MENVTVYRRHSVGCKFESDRYSRRCNCRCWLQYQENGRQVKVSAKTRSWTKADALRKKLEAGEQPEVVVATVKEAIDLWLPVVERHSKSLVKPRRMMNLLLEFCAKKGVTRLNQLTPDLLEEWRQSWTFNFKNSSSAAIHDCYPRRFFRWCEAQDKLPRDPYKRLERFRKADPQTLPLTPNEMQRLLDAVNECEFSSELKYRVRTLILLQRWSGLSIIDALTLSRIALHANNCLTLRRTKTGEEVITALPAYVADSLRMMSNDHAGYFFWNGTKLATSLVVEYSNYLRDVFDRAGISRDRTNGGMTLSHRFRDTFAVEFLQTGGSFDDLASLLGHSNIVTTQKHYGPWSKARQERLRKVAEVAMSQMVQIGMVTQ